MNNKQQTLKISIETIVKRNSNNEETRKIDCHLLQMYEDMLRETFGYTPSTSVMDMLINEEAVNTVKGLDETGEDNIPQESNQKNAKKESASDDFVDAKNAVPEDTSGQSDNGPSNYDKEENDFDRDPQTAMQSDKDSVANNSDENISLEDVLITDTGDSSDDSTKVDKNPSDISEMKLSEKENDVDDTESSHNSEIDESEINSEDTDKFDSYNPEDETYFEDETYLDTNSDDLGISDDETEEIISNDIKDLFPQASEEEDIQSHSDDTQLDSDDSETQLEETDSDAEDSDTLTDSVPQFIDTEGVSEHDHNIDKTVFNNTVDPHTADPAQKVKDLANYDKCSRNRFCTKTCYLTHSIRYCIPGDKHNGKNNTMLGNTDRNERQIIETNTNGGIGSTFDTKNSPSMKNKSEESTVNKTLVFNNKPNTADKTDSGTATSHSPKQILTERDYKENIDTVRLENTEPASNPQSFSYEKIDKLVTQRTSEYGQKIQSLELMIIKLENQLLVEKLNKQNHSSTITRLENMILKLENDLLRMYKNYESLKEETEEINKKQSKYLEIAEKQEQRMNKYPALPNQSAESIEIISKHQLIISELTKTIDNQTTTLNHMKMKSDYLEQQNNILYEMIANQTIFMTQVIQNVKDLTEKNSKQMHEVNELKQKISDMHSSDKFLEISKISKLLRRSGKFINDLDSLASYEKINMNNIHIPDNDKSDLNDAQVFARRWCQRNSFQNNSCLYNTVWRISGCVPFKEIIWGDCLQSINIEKKECTQVSTDYPTLPVLSSGEDNAANKPAAPNSGSKIFNNEVELPEVSDGIKGNSKCPPYLSNDVKQHQSPTVSMGEDSKAETPTASVGKDDQDKLQTNSVSKSNQYNKAQTPSVTNFQDYVIDNVFKYKRLTEVTPIIVNTKIEDMNPHVMEVYDTEETSVSPKDKFISDRNMEINSGVITENTKEHSTENFGRQDAKYKFDNAKLNQNDNSELRLPDDLENNHRGGDFENVDSVRTNSRQGKYTETDTPHDDSLLVESQYMDTTKTKSVVTEDKSSQNLEFKNTESQTDVHYNSNQEDSKQAETLHEGPKSTKSEQDDLIQTNIKHQQIEPSNNGIDNVKSNQTDSTQTSSEHDSIEKPKAENTATEQSESQQVTLDYTLSKEENKKKNIPQGNDTKPDTNQPTDTRKSDCDQDVLKQTGLLQPSTKTSEFQQVDSKMFDSKQPDIKQTGSEPVDTKINDSVQSDTKQSESEGVAMEMTPPKDASIEQTDPRHSDKKPNDLDQEDDKKLAAEEADKHIMHNKHDDTRQSESDNKYKDTKQSDNKDTAAEKTENKVTQSVQTNNQKSDTNDKEHTQHKSDSISAENTKPKTYETEDNAHSPPVDKPKETTNQTKDKKEQKKEMPEKKKPSPRKKPIYLDTENDREPKGNFPAIY